MTDLVGRLVDSARGRARHARLRPTPPIVWQTRPGDGPGAGLPFADSAALPATSSPVQLHPATVGMRKLVELKEHCVAPRSADPAPPSRKEPPQAVPVSSPVRPSVSPATVDLPAAAQAPVSRPALSTKLSTTDRTPNDHAPRRGLPLPVPPPIPTPESAPRPTESDPAQAVRPEPVRAEPHNLDGPPARQRALPVSDPSPVLAPRPTFSSVAKPSAAIHVHIDRIEIQGAPPAPVGAAAPAPAPVPPGPPGAAAPAVLSLADYLRGSRATGPGQA